MRGNTRPWRCLHENQNPHRGTSAWPLPRKSSGRPTQTSAAGVLAVGALTGSTAAIPVLIGLGDSSWFWGRLAPSALAATAALVGALAQLERPHERWALYRRYHRRLEAEQLAYKFRTAPYHDDNRDKLLAQRLGQIRNWIFTTSGKACYLGARTSLGV